MEKMTKIEKVLEFLGIALIAASITLKCCMGVNDSGNLVMLSFTAILSYVILLVCAFFPADWRMTEKQKSQIKDISIYQMRYRKIFVVINFVVSIGTSCLIIAI